MIPEHFESLCGRESDCDDSGVILVVSELSRISRVRNQGTSD